MLTDDVGAALAALAQVIWIDVVLAGDNAIVIGLAAAGLPIEQRRRAIILGIGAAAVLRIIFALATTQLLQIPGIRLFGGLLLVWVCWKMYVELLAKRGGGEGEHATIEAAEPKSMFQAMSQIVVADVSMSLDNVLAVAAAAEEHPEIMVFGLALSVVLMGIGATLIAKLLDRNPWIGWLGLAVIVKVTIELVGEGAVEVLARFGTDLHGVGIDAPFSLFGWTPHLGTMDLAAIALVAALALFGWMTRKPTKEAAV